MSHPDLSWMDDALCIEIGTDPFFPEPNDWTGSQQAQRICDRCPVRQQCADYADTLPWLQGIWAGTTAHQRYQARKAAA